MDVTYAFYNFGIDDFRFISGRRLCGYKQLLAMNCDSGSADGFWGNRTQRAYRSLISNTTSEPLQCGQSCADKILAQLQFISTKGITYPNNLASNSSVDQSSSSSTESSTSETLNFITEKTEGCGEIKWTTAGSQPHLKSDIYRKNIFLGKQSKYRFISSSKINWMNISPNNPRLEHNQIRYWSDANYKDLSPEVKVELSENTGHYTVVVSCSNTACFETTETTRPFAYGHMDPYKVYKNGEMYMAQSDAEEEGICTAT